MKKQNIIYSNINIYNIKYMKKQNMIYCSIEIYKI